MAAPKLKFAIGNSASTTLASGITNTDTSATLTATTNFDDAPVAGEGMVLFDEGTAAEELAYSTGLSGSALTIPLANRGLEGGSAQAHSATSSVRGPLTAGMWNDLVDALIDNVLVQSTGAVDTTKIATLTASQTLTNKTLTSPVINTPTAAIITSLTAETTIADGDLLMIYDDSATALRKMTKSNLVAGLSQTSPKRARVYKDANQSVNSGVNTTITFNQETFDNDSMHDNVTNNSRITATTAGLYLLKAQVAFASNATGVREIFFMKNGSLALASAYQPALNGDRTVLQITTLVEAAATDYFEVQANQGSGGALNIEGAASDQYYQTHFEMVRLGPTS